MSATKRYNQKALYFSDELKEKLHNILEYPLTIVEAPMGYGKTTAIKEYLNSTNNKVLWQRAFDCSLQSFWYGFSHLFDELYNPIGENLEQMGLPDDSISRHEAIRIIDKHELTNDTVLVIDDYHLVDNAILNTFIEQLVFTEVDKLHIVLIGRYTGFQSIEEMKLKSYLYHLTKQNFELTPTGIADYYRLCGINLKASEANELYELTEGWISALYMLMLNYIDEGSFADITNIYSLVEKSIFTPFSQEIQSFLITMHLFDSFTLEQALHMWQKENAGELLTEITGKNAFVDYDWKTKTYNIHNIFTNFLKDRMESHNLKLEVKERAAKWYFKNGDFHAAMHLFYECKDFEQLFFALEQNRTKGLNSPSTKESFIKYFEECPAEVKKKYPLASLIFAFAFTSFNEPTLFARACQEFDANMDCDKHLPEDYRKLLFGEYELLLSFTGYNDINKMSKHHQKAAKLLQKPTIFLDVRGNWTYGVPSVLYMFYRESGKLETHVQDIIKAMPYYYQITGGHGNGAEYVMEAERYFNMGDLSSAEIVMHKALQQAQSYKQFGIVVCALFLHIRICLVKGDYSGILKLFQTMRESIADVGQINLIHTMNICEGYVYSLLKQRNKIPEWLATGDFNMNRLLFPTLPMLNIVYGKVLLMDEDYLRLLGSAQRFIGITSVFPNLLGKIYTYIYLAAANKQVYRYDDGLSALKLALETAMPDKVYMPFVENAEIITPLLEQLSREGFYREDIDRILDMAKDFSQSVSQIIAVNFLSDKKPRLTEREKEIVRLASNGLTNKEIGQKLYLSSNTIKTQLKSIFEKLGVNSRVLLKQYQDKI
ncbi:MAG: LuxR C-terminal-related transcriptional regulator [Bacillota bacterium]|nr:LuxR C-terminal-related transcriptional regulator [Bacillota bacterium]